jgi:hypothetical protein
MLPDYIIYDELKREREKKREQESRPQLEVPRYIPYWPQPEFDAPQYDQEEPSGERGVAIIQT